MRFLIRTRRRVFLFRFLVIKQRGWEFPLRFLRSGKARAVWVLWTPHNLASVGALRAQIPTGGRFQNPASEAVATRGIRTCVGIRAHNLSFRTCSRHSCIPRLLTPLLYSTFRELSKTPVRCSPSSSSSLLLSMQVLEGPCA